MVKAWRLFSVAVASAFGLGFMRPGPGTWGSVGAAVAALVLIDRLPVDMIQPILAAAACGALVLGVIVCPGACRWFERKDPSQVVIDEVAGVFAAAACVPAVHSHAAPLSTVAVALVAFRVFDIAKPWPVYSLEALPGALGIMADDLAAGLLAGALTAALMH